MEHEKVDWSQAPEWAGWWAIDRVDASWYEQVPLWSDECGFWLLVPEWDTAPKFGIELGSMRGKVFQRPPEARATSERSADLPATSSDACASEPSQEFKYTWWEPASAEYGQWHRSKEAANSEARSNFLDFKGKLSEREVLLVECVGVANAGESGE